MISSKKLKNFNKKFDIVSLFVIIGNKILLLKRHHNKPQAGLWGPPAGKVDQGEDLVRSIIREVYEETGIQVNKDKLEYFTKKYYVRHGKIDFVFHVFSVKLENLPEVKLNNGEHVEYGWFDVQQAMYMDLVEDEYVPLKDYFNL